MQENNKDKSAKEAGDEIIEILDDYRKKHGGPQQDEALTEIEPDNSSDDGEALPTSILSHFTAEADEPQNGNNTIYDPNPHLSDEADKKELQKAQKMNREQRFKKEKKPTRKFVIALGGGSIFFKALFYLAFVLIISAYLSYYIIAIGNDVFALVKDSTPVIIDIREGATEDEIIEMLVEKDLIEYGWVFKQYLKYRSKEEYSFIVGEHELSSDMNYTEIIQKLTLKHTTRFQVRIVIPEGLTVDQIIDIFLENGMGTKEGFVEAINNYPYKHEFVKQLEELGYPEDRKYRLEGYLYPDTYDFYIDAKEYLIINTLLNNFNRKFWSGYKSEYQDICEELGMTFDDIITLASMIEAEGNNALDFEYISYVFHNRIKNSTKYPEFQFLQSDATIQYVLDARREDLTVDDLKLDNPYNTYVYKGLPPGAICNPGYDAISAALYPSAPVDDNDKTINAFYFVSNKVGKTYYSTTLLGHNNNKEKVRKDNAAIDAGTYYN